MRNCFGAGALTMLLLLLSCNPPENTTPSVLGPTVLEAHGYVVPADSIAEPKVIFVDESKLKKIPAGTPKVVPTNTNIHPVGKPKVVIAGTPRICTPGQGAFSLPVTVPAVDSPFIAGIPEIVIAKDAYIKDQNPQNFSTFGKLQGLKHDGIISILQDKLGNLWFGTYGGGVTRYDGKTFTHYTVSEGLPDNQVWSILEDKVGNLWFGTLGGLCRYDGKAFTNFTESKGFLNNYVYSILEDKAGYLWFGTRAGVSRYDGKTFTHFTKSEGLPDNWVLSSLEDKAGNIWFGTRGGASRYDGKAFANYTQTEGLSHNFVTRIMEDNAGNLWFSTYGGGVSRYTSSSPLDEGETRGVFTHFTTSEGLINNVAYPILEDKAGDLWFGTLGGVSRYTPASPFDEDRNWGVFTDFTKSEGMPQNGAWSILEDKAGNLWFGTNGSGVSKYDGKMFTHLTEKEGLSNSSITGILEDRAGNLWFGALGGASRYDGKTFTHFALPESLSNNFVYKILEDKAGNLWFVTSGAGRLGSAVIRLTLKGNKGSNQHSYTLFAEPFAPDNQGLPGIYSIMEDKTGNIWIGTSGGAYMYEAPKSGRLASFTHFTEKEGLSNNDVRDILEDKAGNLWFATYHGGVTRLTMSKVDGSHKYEFVHFNENAGLSSDPVVEIMEDKAGNLWFSTYGGGAIRYEPRKDASAAGHASFTLFTEKEGLASNVVASILEDNAGNLWFGTRLGLSVLNRSKLVEVNHKINSNSFRESDVLFTNYGYDDGFLGIGSGKLYEDRNGTIWITSSDRLTAYHPPAEGEILDTAGPVIQLTGIALFNELIHWQQIQDHQDSTLTLGNGIPIRNFSFDSTSRWYGLPENLRLAYNNNSLTFNFIGITMRQPKKVKYQYKLEGMDKNWSALTARTEAPYGNLPHGSYTFKVKAMNSAGNWSDESHYPFAIRPPWWLTWWAYSLYGLTSVFVLLQIHKYQKASTLRTERERTQQRELAQAKEIEIAYTQLKATQAQLIQSEKMASLGELTAGIAHEIQNPLNFVNNFSEVNSELIVELKEEVEKGNLDEIKTIVQTIDENEQKIVFHGKRADAIVKGMLQHSRSNTGIKEPTDINALSDEYLRLAYHGLRAKDKTFNATMKTDFDESIGKINVVPQDIGRVILNLITNAFYACSEKGKGQQRTANGEEPDASGQPPVASSRYQPTVTVTTKRIASPSGVGGRDAIVEIRVRDNGNGIPQHVVDKIFQPFFTTKPTGQGTGLGLSLSYDIVKAHGGEIKIETQPGEGVEFIIILPA